MSINKSISSEIDKDVLQRLYNMFMKTKKEYEFEFVFFSKNNNYMQQDKYVKLIKIIDKKSVSNKDYTLVKPVDILDITYKKDNNTLYRCVLTEKENINKIMKKVEKLTPIMTQNHIIMKILTQMYIQKDDGIYFMKKVKIEDPVDVDDFNFRGKLSGEYDLKQEEITELLLLNQNASRYITFRYKQRTSLYLLGKPKSTTLIKIDLTETKFGNYYKQVNKNISNYELEIEYNTDKPKKEDFNKMMAETEYLLKIINQSNFILPMSKSIKVLDYYKSLIKPIQFNKLDGRQPRTLELQYTIESLANKYAVTDKADGDRHFLIIFNNRCYLISSGLYIKDTGIVLSDSKSKYNGSILDGEYIFIAKKNRHIFLVFDCLFYCGNDIRMEEKLFERLNNADDIIKQCFIFTNQKGIEYSSYSNKKEFNLQEHVDFHQKEIQRTIELLNYDIDIEKLFPLVRRKYFIGSLGAKPWEIFAYASVMWNTYKESKCPYILDGLIFQPLVQKYITSATGSHDFKWKPPESNSFDFYVEFEKDKFGNEIVAYDNSYSEEIDDYKLNVPYKIARLHVGQSVGQIEKPILFKENESLCYAHLYLKKGEARDIEGNIILDKTVVEFYYDMNDDVLKMYKWIPMRTRYDKTDSVNRFGRQYGNYTTTADGVWRSVVNPTLVTDFNDLAVGNDPIIICMI
jgi:hypothetical protein